VSRGRFFVGTSGWSYEHWRGLFYPGDMPPRQWFAHYASYFPSVEINYTFYRLPTEKTFTRWREQEPGHFVYALKAPRSITHLKKLRQPKETLYRFLERARLLGSKLGPILYQLPPNWHCNVERLAEFLELLPSDLQHVIEFRDQSWHCDEVFSLLRKSGVSFCIISLPDFPCLSLVTGPIVYLRMHGVDVRYGDSYDEEQLRDCARRVVSFLREGHDTFVYFNNEAQAYAVENAWELRHLVEELMRRNDAQRSYAISEVG
jgi:uncharacterized protein YecE (DUF72 family)